MKLLALPDFVDSGATMPARTFKMLREPIQASPKLIIQDPVLKVFEIMMKKIIVVFLIILSMFIFKRVDAVRFPVDFVLDNLPKFIEQLKRTAVLILVTDNKIVIGTGFLVRNEKEEILVVTNKHVANAGKPIFVRVNTQDKVMDYLAKIYRVDTNLDLAILILKKTTPDQQWISTDLMIPDEMYGKESDIIEGKEVIYIGYPLGLGAEEKNYPVSRQGLIAQFIPNRKTFLVDGFASHGNSGSPVFSKKDGKLLGIVTSFEPDFIDSFEETKLMSRIPFNSGISKVISIEAIKELILEKK